MIARPPRCSVLLRAMLLAAPALHASIASAQLSAAPGGPGIGATANGVPLVQINAPNAAGVSHNPFQNYSVGANGLVLNNSVNGAATQIGGNVAGNAALANGAASVILNEVVGNARTMLNGTTEIAGQRAALIVANPNGISVNGGSVLNASRVTLTTGTPTLASDGAVSGFSVAGGDIAIGGKGFDAGTVDKVDLLSRSMTIDGAVRAKELVRAVAGRNDIAYAGERIDAKQTNANDLVPVRAIDVAALGGMYANAISLRSTEGGAGVNIAGKVQALTGNLKVEKTGNVIGSLPQDAHSGSGSDGLVVAGKATENKLSVQSGAQLIAAGAADIRSDSMENGGKISGATGATINSATLINRGTIESDRDITLDTATLENKNAIKAGGALSLRTATLINDGTVLAQGGDLTVDSTTLTNTGTLGSATGTTKLKATTFSNSGDITASRDLAVNATTGMNTGLLSSDHGDVSVSSLTFTNTDRMSAKEGKVKVQSMLYSNKGTIEQAKPVAQVKPVEQAKPVQQAKPTQVWPVQVWPVMQQIWPVQIWPAQTKPVQQAWPAQQAWSVYVPVARPWWQAMYIGSNTRWY